LKDPEKRAAYDQFGANFKAGQDFRPPPGWDAGFSINSMWEVGDANCYTPRIFFMPPAVQTV
jgi:curved DNA-binding protein